MAKNHIQPGKNITYSNSGSLIASGQPVLINDLFGVALVDIATGGVGEVATEQVYALPKVSGGMNPGQIVYWDPAGNPVGGVAGSGALTTTPGALKRAGIVWAAAVAGDATVAVKLNA